jgi:putative oxidoreductase
MLKKLFSTQNDFTLTILRAVLGVVFLAHGSQKVLGWFGGHGFTATMAGFERMGIPTVFAFLAIAAEFGGGLGLILGLLSRIAAFGITVEMAVAVALIHRNIGLFMNWTGTQRGEGYEFHLLVLAIGISLVVRGAGALSMDRLIFRSLETDAAGRDAKVSTIRPAA